MEQKKQVIFKFLITSIFSTTFAFACTLDVSQGTLELTVFLQEFTPKKVYQIKAKYVNVQKKTLISLK